MRARAGHAKGSSARLGEGSRTGRAARERTHATRVSRSGDGGGAWIIFSHSPAAGDVCFCVLVFSVTRETRNIETRKYVRVVRTTANAHRLRRGSEGKRILFLIIYYNTRIIRTLATAAASRIVPVERSASRRRSAARSYRARHRAPTGLINSPRTFIIRIRSVYAAGPSRSRFGEVPRYLSTPLTRCRATEAGRRDGRLRSGVCKDMILLNKYTMA